MKEYFNKYALQWEDSQRVRSRVTGENLLQLLITNDKLGSCPNLGKLLEDMTVLQELVNLPDILHLQSYLLDRFSGKVSSTEMEKISVREFSERIDLNSRARFLKQAQTVLECWNKLRQKVAERGILAAEIRDTEVYRLDTNTTRNTPVAFLFPASRGSGLCSYGLVMFMIEANNKITSSSTSSINPYQASVYHLSAFSKSDLQSLLLSHTSYTFLRSGLTKEEYDVQGMERKVVERFVLSKPRLDGAIRKVYYRAPIVVNYFVCS